MVVSESLDGKIEKVDEVNEYLTSPHKEAVRSESRQCK